MKKAILSIIMTSALTVAVAQTVTNPDMQFATDAAQAGMLEVKLGQLTATKASSDKVKMLGKHMVADHTKAGNELKALAAKKNMTLPATLSTEGQTNYDELSKKSGADFDKAYTALMVQDHEKVVAKFKTESESGADADLKSWASKTLPTLQHHLMMSKETDAAVNK